MKLLVAMLFFSIIYMLQKRLFLKYWDKNLKVHIALSNTILIEGQKAYLEETIENDKFLPLPILYVKFAAPQSFIFSKDEKDLRPENNYRNDVFSVMPHQRISRKYSFICSRRGFYTIKHLDIISKDLFLTEILATHTNIDTSIHILPKKLLNSELNTALLLSLGDMINKYNLYEDPFEFKGIRDYQPYDSIRMVNWKCTARTGALQVNTYYSTCAKEISLYLNVEPNALYRADYLQEESIRLASTIASELISANVSFSFYTNGVDKISKQAYCIDAGSGIHHINQIDLALARIDLSQKPTDFCKLLDEISHKDPNKHQIIIISNYRKDDLLKAYSDIVERGFSTLFIVPEFKDTPVNLDLPNINVWEVDYLEKIS
ncbi:DUF58 domain-containing protein [Clostridium sp. Marseille-P299]|uniref:DUF58 domain-containing protein n=1 Tax=Clostridium sp. Marseille-P299 TaxID=1805477 RepID=UPI00082B9710|nr:DUF58 domain-containing protein [Clostridium sp. Marseille-P299]